MESKQNRYILIGLITICVVLVVVTSITNSWLAPLRTGMGYVLIPIRPGVNRVGSVICDELVNFSQLKTALEENAALKQEVSELTETNSCLMLQQFKLERPHQLYELDQNYLQYEKVAARVIANDMGDQFQVFRISKGSADGIEVGNSVMAGGGLVGIVTDTGANYATVRPIIDDSSRVSAIAMQSGDTCLAGGNLMLYKEGRLHISDIKKNADVREGNRAVTSNISSAFPSGVLAGYAMDITVDNNQLISFGYPIPVVGFDSLQEVLIIAQVKQTEDTTGEWNETGID